MMAIPRNAVYKPNHASFGAFMLSSGPRLAAIEAAADIAQVAAAAAQRSTGRYASRFRVNFASAPVVVDGNPRVGAEVYNDDPAAAPQEFGDRWGNPGHHTLRLAGQPWHTPKAPR